MNRGRILESWRRKRSAGEWIRGGPAGPDFISVSNADKLDLPAGARGVAGLLALGDANALSLACARERVPKSGATPVIAGVCGTDPLRLMDKFLQELQAAGVAGVQNAPSVGLIDGGFRSSLEEGKLGYRREVEMVRLASHLELLRIATVFSAEDARAMAEAGADLVVVHPGLDPKRSLKDRVKRIEEAAAAARAERKGVFVLAFGAPESLLGDVKALDGIQIESAAGLV